MQYNQKRQESPVKGHNRGFLPLTFSNLQHLGRYTILNGMRFLKFLVENKAFHFSKRALYAGTARNKWLKCLYNTFRKTFTSAHKWSKNWNSIEISIEIFWVSYFLISIKLWQAFAKSIFLTPFNIWLKAWLYQPKNPKFST